MANESTSNSIRYTGLLECPLRSGFVEFEYSQGDCVSDLLNRVVQLWSPEGKGVYWHAGFSDIAEWKIFCQDSDGAYVPVGSDDEIPICPPSPTFVSERRPRQGPMADLFGPTLGDVAQINAEGGVLDERHGRFLGILLNRHLDFKLNRDYTLPDAKQYSIKMLALVALFGG